MYLFCLRISYFADRRSIFHTPAIWDSDNWNVPDHVSLKGSESGEKDQDHCHLMKATLPCPCVHVVNATHLRKAESTHKSIVEMC